MTVEIRPVQTTAEVLDLKLERNSYRPGKTVRGTVVLRPFRSERITRKVAIEVPEDRPDGDYTLTVCGADRMGMLDTMERPHDYDPRTVSQLFASVRRVVRFRGDRLYVHLPLGRGGVVVRKQELPRKLSSHG